MAKSDKQLVWRMEGYKAALYFAKEHGIEELEKDIRQRGFLGIPVGISKAQKDNFILQVSENLTATVQTVALMALRTDFGFGEKRLKQFKQAFDKETSAIFDFDRLGQHYVTMEDYAVYLNKEFGIDLDAERVAACQDSCKIEMQMKDKVDLNVILSELESGGFKQAAEFLQSKM